VSIPSFVLIQGVIIGLTYGLLAVGLVLVYKSNRVLNFAHGQIGVISAVLLSRMVNKLGAPYWPTVILVIVLAAGLGAGVEFLLRRLFNAPRFLVMVATIGIAQVLFLLSILKFVKGPGFPGPFPLPFSFKAHIGTFVIGPPHFAILIFAPLAAIAVAAFFSLTSAGLAVRAAAENADSARLGGIWVRRMSTLTWMVAGMLSAITAILVSPFSGQSFSEALGPDLLVRALAAALLGSMVNLRVAFLAGIGVGVIEQIVFWNNPVGGTVEASMFGLLLFALLLRGRTLRAGGLSEDATTWRTAAATRIRSFTAERRRVGRVAAAVTLVVALALPAVLNQSRAFLFSNMLVYGIIALSLTLLSGWAGQLSLGHFALVSVGALFTAHFGESWPLPLLLLVAGLATAAVAVLIGLPALRVRGLYLAVTTLGFAVLMQIWIVNHPQLGLPEPTGTFIERPKILGFDLGPRRTFYYFALALLLLALAGVRNLRRSGVARAIIAVRDNETNAAAMGIRVTRVKLAAFAFSGFLAGIAGVALAYNFGILSASSAATGTGSFSAFESIVAVSMVVIGGMGSIKGSLLGAVYLLGIPAMFGYSQVVGFLTSGIGLTVFILYFPGGLAGALDRAGDGIARFLAARAKAPAPDIRVTPAREVAS
jgi:ABC-type branched-subunit amino acid transport system permease subunit